ncbi:hypothetical protein AAVH_40322 [Aphelenchoides avenae]|nr:hypothetical protein AAVH_40322 [Aphelenchus avenae]
MDMTQPVIPSVALNMRITQPYQWLHALKANMMQLTIPSVASDISVVQPNHWQHALTIRQFYKSLQNELLS